MGRLWLRSRPEFLSMGSEAMIYEYKIVKLGEVYLSSAEAYQKEGWEVVSTKVLVHREQHNAVEIIFLFRRRK